MAGATAASAPVRRGPRLSALVGGGVVLWGLTIGLRPLADNSFFTHLATGRLIVDSGIPRSDPYSFTADGDPWVVQSWLASLTWGLLERAGGGGAVLVSVGVLTALLAGLVWLLTAPAGALASRVGLAGVVVGVGSVMWAARPLVFALVLLAGVLLVLERERVPPWVVLPAFWVWTNVHGSFPLGIVVIVCFLAGRWYDDRARPDRDLRILGFAVGGTLLGAINPLGPRLLVFPVELLGRSEQLRYVIEWQSPDFSSTWTRLFLLQVVMAILVLVRRPSARAAIPLVVFVAASLIATRNIAVASLVMLPGLARGLAGMGSLDGRRATGLVGGVAAAALALLGLLLAVGATSRPFGLDSYPVTPVAWLDEQGLLGGEVRMATSDTTGNLLELLQGTDAEVFVDDRYDMYPAAIVEGLADLTYLRPGWEDVLDEQAVDLVLWEAREPLAGALAAHPEWRIVYADGQYVIAARR